MRLLIDADSVTADFEEGYASEHGICTEDDLVQKPREEAALTEQRGAGGVHVHAQDIEAARNCGDQPDWTPARSACSALA